MIFKNTYLKLTLFYVLIVMIISVFFSIAIYQISSREIYRGLGPEARIFRDLRPPNLSLEIEQLRSAQIQESNDRLKINLFYFNILILMLSTITSYFLAKRTLRPIENAMTAQNRFTADASHELRTPLAAMKTEIEVALRDKKFNNLKAQKLLKSNLEEIDKLEILSASLLKLVRTDSGVSQDFEELSLTDTVVEAYGKVESLAAKKSIEFRNNLKEIKIIGDRESLTELFVILLDNAIKYSPENSKISIDIHKEKKRAIVKIKDKGIGIKASDLPYIFNRFYRADNSRSKEQVSGFGLGLSIAKEIIELHHGTINVQSEPHKGSEFEISLPTR